MIINKETNGDKGKSKKESISKLSLGDKSPIIHQTTNWRLDNAVEPTHFIKNNFPDPIILQTVRNALKQTTFHNVIRTVILTESSPPFFFKKYDLPSDPILLILVPSDHYNPSSPPMYSFHGTVALKNIVTECPITYSHNAFPRLIFLTTKHLYI